jgi:2-phospho-L-lactate guanylyltransferase
MADVSTTHWTVVIAVKRLRAAKSRLRGAVPDEWHQALALAMVRDTVTAVLRAAEVGRLLVVTDDPAAAAAVTALGAEATPDRPDAGLNAAFAYGADVLAGPAGPRAALAGDLPALTGADLGEVLRGAHRRSFMADAAATDGEVLRSTRRRSVVADAAGTDGEVLRGAHRRSFVADAAGTGTVLLAAPAGVALDPRFGVGSAAAHADSGAWPLAGDWPGLRQDVDIPADLRAVLALGAGAHTCALLRDLGLIADCGAGPPRTAPAR